MPGMLTRSKSLRFLKSGRRDANTQEDGNFMQLPKGAQVALDKSRSATPISKTEDRLESPEMAVRPSTSSGPGECATPKKTNAAPSFYTQKHAFTFASATNSTTVLSTGRNSTEEQGIIGIALGSPTVGSHWNPEHQVADSNLNLAMPRFQRADSPAVAADDGQAPPKSKLSRWKSLFRKAAPPPPQPEKPAFYQLAQAPVAAPRADSHHDEEAIESRTVSTQETDKARKALPPTYNPGIRASRRGAPDGFIAPQSPPDVPSTRDRAFTLGNTGSTPRLVKTMQRSFTSPHSHSRNMNETAPPIPQDMISGNKHSLYTQVTGASGSANRSLLDVSIPDVTMERYSVMFGNLLQPGTNQSSSLLARRQANAEKIKPLTDLVAKEDVHDELPDFKLPRRATTPVPSPSPRLSLFPNTAPSRAPSPLSGPISKPKVLHRSKTSPAKSPLRQTFAEKPQETATKTEPRLVVLKPSVSPQLNPVLTPTSIHSFESDAESITIIVAQTQPLKITHTKREPTWEIINKPTPTSNSTLSPPATTITRSDSQRQPRPTKLSALSSHPASAPLDTPSPLQRFASLTSPPLSAGDDGRNARRLDKRSVATVGVARSVSVSKANSQRARLNRARTEGDSARGEERLVERQALTPMMVEVRNRKSQRVTLEMAA